MGKSGQKCLDFFLEFYLDVLRLIFLKKILAIYSDCDIIKLKKGKKVPKTRKEIKKMRVTKTVREYIEKCVREKVYKKYEEERIIAENENNAVNAFWEALSDEIEAIAREKVAKFVNENEFVEMTETRCTTSNITNCYSNRVKIKDKVYENSVHNWRHRADKEANEKVTDIIVTLELGGTKADLDRMLSEI